MAVRLLLAGDVVAEEGDVVAQLVGKGGTLVAEHVRHDHGASAANRRTSASPWPRAPPVTMTTLPSRSSHGPS